MMISRAGKLFINILGIEQSRPATEICTVCQKPIGRGKGHRYKGRCLCEKCSFIITQV